MLALTTVLLVVAPLALVVVVLGDVLSRRYRIPTARLYLFTLQYAINDSVEILVAPFLGFFPGLAGRVQLWSLRLLRRRAAQLLGMRIDVTGLDDLCPGPVVLVARHVSLFDASLPALMADDAGLTARGVVMAELLADPGFDLLYSRLGSVFIPRDDGPEALRLITGMVDAIPDPSGTVVAIFPEGRLYRPTMAELALDRLRERDPDRARRLAGLVRSLPPRPGGMWALLQAWPEADVVVLEHEGLDAIATAADLRRRIPLNGPVRVNLRRIARADLPTDRNAFVRWLDELWLELDGAAPVPVA